MDNNKIDTEPQHYIEVAPIFSITKFDIIQAEQTICCEIGIFPNSLGLLFGCIAPDYFLECRAHNGYFELVRNGIGARVPIPENIDGEFRVVLTVMWGPKTLYIRINSILGLFEDKCETPITFPPSSLREWARQQLILNPCGYNSCQGVYLTVYEYLQDLRDKIISTNAINGFWDKNYNGSKLLSSKPKREVDIHPQIRLLLDNLDIIKGIQVIPEYKSGAGSIDFLLTARNINNKSFFHICLEVKHAHSSDLLNGIKIQLPKYMDTINTDFGIYCVLYFGSEYKYDKNLFKTIDTDNCDYKDDDLEYLLMLSNDTFKNIRPIVLNVSKKTPPSKLG